jgi:ABC transport system ATP-binding/permease protein
MYEGEGKWDEYAGGYTDMLAQRGAGVAARKLKAEAKQKSEPQVQSATPKASKGKLSFKDKYALETLPIKIETLKAEMAKLEKELADPELFTKNYAKFEKTSARFTSASQELENAEVQWLELEMLREELEA